ncbi:MAG: hypothetical protein RR495_06005 [Anaerovoracaceae bacterium]
MKNLIIKNAQIYRGTQENPWAESLLVENGKVTAIGNASLDALAKSNPNDIVPDTNTEILDLQKKYVVPDVANAVSFLDFNMTEDLDTMLDFFNRKTIKSLIGDILVNTIDIGSDGTFIIYETNPLSSAQNLRFPEPEMIISKGEIIYDLEESNRAMMFNLALMQQL